MRNIVQLHIEQSNIKKLYQLIVSFLILNVFVLIPLMLYSNLYLDLNTYYTHSRQVLTILIISAVVLSVEALVFKRYLRDKPTVINWNYNSLIFLKFFFSIPIFGTINYYNMESRGSSAVFILFILLIALILRVHGYRRYILTILFTLIYASGIYFSNISYIEDPYVYILGIIVIAMFFYITKMLNQYEYRLISNKYEIKNSNESLQELNDKLKETNQNLSLELQNKLLVFDKNKELLKRLSKYEAVDQLTTIDLEEIQALLSVFKDNAFTDYIEERFLSLNSNFINILLEKYPDLNVNNIKLCILHKMGYSLKEIAEIRSVTYNSIKVSTSRLRKKLNVDTSDITLFAHLNSLEEEYNIQLEMLNTTDYQPNYSIKAV